MSKDRRCELLDTDVPLTAYQLSLVRAEVPAIRQGRQQDFLKFCEDVLRGLAAPTDHDVRTAIKAASERYGRPA